MNEIVKYNNDMNICTSLRGFNKNELNFLMAICSKMRYKGEDQVIFTFKQLENLTQWKDKNKKEFVKSLKNTNKKLLELTFELRTENKIVQFALFPTFEIDLDDNTLTVEVHKRFSFLLNQIADNFTRFELEHFTALKSKYSQLLYKELMQFKRKGYRIFTLESFREKLDIPKTYQMTHIKNKILSPALKELSLILENLKFNPKSMGKGKAYTHFEFYFKPIFDEEEDIEKEVIDAEIIEFKPIDEIKEFWIQSFPGVNFTKKHSEVLEKLLQKNSVSYLKNYLKEQWEYVNQSELVKNKEAYFSSLILEEKAVPKDYIPNEHKEIKKEETMRLFEEPKEEKIEIKHLTEDDYIQTALFTEKETIKEPTQEEEKTLTKEEYEKQYFDYLDGKEDTKIQRSIFSLAMRKKGYQVQEKKVYTVEDIPEEKLLSKGGKKLVGSALQMRVDKILKNMNEGEH